MSTSRPLLEVHNLTVRFPMHEVVAVDRLSFQIARGERVALVGGSGSGKSATALALIGLSDAAAVVEASSRIVFDGHELPALEDESSDTLRTLRGNRIAMIFQDPAAALNPSMSVRDQIAETALVHSVSPAVALRDAEAEEHLQYRTVRCAGFPVHGRAQFRHLRAGQLVEDAPVERLFRAPEHPVSVALIRAVPRLA
ncbi:ABC transporter ATP-binding protein, partial [bacterium]|nr:ABC transporter ATP-binding protein [bacterium]